MSQDRQSRLDRLAGDGISVAGIDLAALFRVILTRIHDNADGLTVSALVRPVQDAVTNHARIAHLYGGAGADPFTTLIGDALDQAQDRGLVGVSGGTWQAGPKLVTGKRLVVIPARKGKHASVGVVLYDVAERATRGVAEKRQMEITSLAASLREDGAGLRPLNDDHVESLAQSMRDFRYRPEFPVLTDQHGRILDGRHRRAAARRANVPEPQPRVIHVSSDEEALGFAFLVNNQRGWTRAERNRIDRDLQAAGLTLENFGRVMGTAAKRELIRAALAENPDDSHRKIADRLCFAHSFVDKVCREEVDSESTSCSHGQTGQGARTDRKLKAEPSTSRASRKWDDPELLAAVRAAMEAGESVTGVANRLGVVHSTANRARIHIEGLLAGKRQAAQEWQATAEVLSDPGALAEIAAASAEIARGDVIRGIEAVRALRPQPLDEILARQDEPVPEPGEDYDLPDAISQAREQPMAAIQRINDSLQDYVSDYGTHLDPELLKLLADLDWEIKRAHHG